MEIAGFFPLNIPGFGAALGTRIYQALGRVKFLEVDRVDSGAFYLKDTYQVRGIVKRRPEGNDLVSTVSSVHCRECGFTPLTTGLGDAAHPYNHSALKNDAIMQMILEHIGTRFPVGSYVGR